MTVLDTNRRDEVVAAQERGRVVARRRPLPGGRAVVGGLLVAVSAVGAYAVAGADDGRPSTSYAVVTSDVGPGTRLDRSDLGLVALDLAPPQRSVAFVELADLVGATTLGPLVAGQLVQVSDVAKPAGGPERAQISLPVDPAHALDGGLGAGDRVDVIVTYTHGGEPDTFTVSRGALVVDVGRGSADLGGAGTLTLVLAVPPAELEPLAAAAAVGEVTVARTTGVARAGSDS